MLTNIIATIAITLVTNVSERFPQHLVQDPPPKGEETYAVFHGHYESDENTKTKYVLTRVWKKTTARFSWDGEQRDFELKSENVSFTSVELRLEKKWIPITTNQDILAGFEFYGVPHWPFTLTNYNRFIFDPSPPLPETNDPGLTVSNAANSAFDQGVALGARLQPKGTNDLVEIHNLIEQAHREAWKELGPSSFIRKDLW